jgi:hypothetical protein
MIQKNLHQLLNGTAKETLPTMAGTPALMY